LDQILHALHLDEWQFLLVKRVSLKISRKTSFAKNLADNPGPWGGRSVGCCLFYLIPEFLAKGFEKMRFRADGPRGRGGRSTRCRERSVIRYRTGCFPVDRADGPRPARPRTVRVAQADGPHGPGGRSARPNGQSPQPLTFRFYRWNSNGDSPRGTRFVPNG
jgi:hypothetical protein